MLKQIQHDKNGLIMDKEQLLEKYPFLKHNLLPLALGMLGLIFLGYGLISLVGSSSSKEIIFESGQDSVLSSDSEEDGKPSQIIVDVGGAVLKPDVYTLPFDSRVSDGLIAAGGLSEEANREWVAKNLNMAAKLSDGSKIYIPRKGESITPLRQGFGGQAGMTGSLRSSEQININTASTEELDSLPGIGPVTAEKIINGRPYGSIDELLSKKIVGNKVFEDIKEKITVY